MSLSQSSAESAHGQDRARVTLLKPPMGAAGGGSGDHDDEEIFSKARDSDWVGLNLSGGPDEPDDDILSHGRDSDWVGMILGGDPSDPDDDITSRSRDSDWVGHRMGGGPGEPEDEDPKTFARSEVVTGGAAATRTPAIEIEPVTTLGYLAARQQRR